jgi:HK97 family phage portal protein
MAGAKAVTKSAGTIHTIDKRTKSYLQGKAEFSPSTSAKHAIRASTDDMTEIEQHPVLDLLADINPWGDGFSWREGVFSDLQSIGQAFTHVVDGDDPKEMWRLLPHITRVVPDPVDFVSHFESGSGLDMQRFEKEDILWFRLFDPTNPWGGLSPLEAWLRTVESSEAIQSFQYELLTRFGVPDYILTSERDFTQDQADSIRKGFRQLFSRMGRRKESIATIGGGAKLERLTETNRELEFNKSQDQLRNSIGQAFGVPQSVLTTDDVNRANARESNLLWFKTTLWPMIQRVENVLNEQLLPKYGGRLVLIHDNPIPDDRAERISERASQLQSGWSLNEIRADDGAEALDDPLADEPMVGGGYAPLSMGSQMAEDGIEEEVEEEVPTTGVAPEQVLAGQQITAALEIVDRVVTGKIPRESGIGMLVVFFNLTPEQAESLMPPEDFEPTEPEIPPGLGPPGAGGEQPPPGQPKPEEAPPPKAYKHIEIVYHADLMAKAGPNEPVGVGPMADELTPVFRRHAERIARRVQRAVQIQTDVILSEADVEQLASELAGVARPHIEVAMTSAGREAVAQVIAERPDIVGTSFDLQNPRVQNYLRDASRRIGTTATDSFRTELREALMEGMEAGESTGQVARRIRDIKDSEFTKYRAERIARTEMRFAHTNANIEGWAQSGVVSGKQFLLAPRACEFCNAVADKWGSGRDDDPGRPGIAVPLDAPFYSLGDVITAEVARKDGTIVERTLQINYADLQGPPIHPNCRCKVIPIVSEERE